MEDPYGSSDSEDISSYLQVLLHNSSSSAAAASVPVGGDAPVAKYFSGINFSDLRNFIAEETDKFHDPSTRAKNFASSCEESDASENQSNPGHSRCSSKRSRAAEVHNLSEKRRRSRINEKLKALQSLIPNSNKTDKASMLDEAIEYLKQLQLQVQVLTIRNGISLHPGYTLGGPLQPTLMPSSGPELGNGTNSHSRGNHVLMQNDMENINHGYPTPQMLGPYSMANDSSHSGFLPSVVPSLENQYVDFNQLDISCSRNNSSQSPGVSS